jgi:hypothetical protein
MHRRTFLRLYPLFAALLVAVLATAATAPATADESDGPAIRAVITAQMDAFARDDGPAAFAFASPAIRDGFRTPERFMAMVRSSYAVVYRPQSWSFGETIVAGGEHFQVVRLTAPDGARKVAFYLMERQHDGGWRIGGVILDTLPERET